MSFYHLPHPWDPGYAIPRYVMSEPPERGAMVTQWLPRGTISEVIPDYFAKRVSKTPAASKGLAGLGAISGGILPRTRTATCDQSCGCAPQNPCCCGEGSMRRTFSRATSAMRARAGSTLSRSSLSGSCFSGGHSLSGSTLDGNSLGATRYELEDLGETAAATVAAPAPVAVPVPSTAKKVAIAAVAIAGAYFLFKKKKRK